MLVHLTTPTDALMIKFLRIRTRAQRGILDNKPREAIDYFISNITNITYPDQRAPIGAL